MDFCVRSDFLATHESNLNKLHETFSANCKELDVALDNAQTILDKVFVTKPQEDCKRENRKLGEYLTRDELMNGQFNELRQELFELQEFHRIIELDLCKIKESVNFSFHDNDLNLLGRTLKDQNNILAERLLSFEKHKSLHQKVLTTLTLELENFKAKVEPFVECEAYKSILETRQCDQKKIESQFNAEVNRLQELFLKKWIEALKWKNKYEKVNNTLTIKVQPKIVKLNEKLIERKEKLLKVQEELAVKKVARDKQESIDDELTDSFKALKKEFYDLSLEIEEHEKETKTRKHLIKETASTIKNTKKDFQRNFIDLNENEIISRQFNQIQQENLKLLLKKSSEHSEKCLIALNCVIDGIKTEVCRMRSNIREAEIAKVKLICDDHHLKRGILLNHVE